MTVTIDETHNPAAESWLPSANGHDDFPIQNLPLGVFAPPQQAPRGGIAIGDEILDLKVVCSAGLLSGAAAAAAGLATGEALNEFLSQGAGGRAALRKSVFSLLRDQNAEKELRHVGALHAARSCTMKLPARIGDYTDFYAGIHHAMNIGRLFRPDSPLTPNYMYVPIGYHGRASSITVSGTQVHRPVGQLKLAADEPIVSECRKLDYEYELGIWIGPGNVLGEPIGISDAASHIAGFCILNDWSARDIQAWEYQPLGPFLAKNFVTTISPWMVTPEALAPFRTPVKSRDASSPRPLPYLTSPEDQQSGGFDISLETHLSTAKMREQNVAPYKLSLGNAGNLFWTPAQLITHHTIGGCNLRPGDLLGTGTISSPSPQGLGSLMEITANGSRAITLPSGEKRTFLEPGDEIAMTAHCHRDGFASIGFGSCRGEIIG